jgi:thioredoxin-like negative regulator of GroEL
MKDAKTLVENKAYDKALAIYLDVWAKAKNPAAGTDAAIMYDILGRLDDALTLIDQVASESGDKSAIKEQARLKQLKIENDKLAEQLK